MYLYVTFFPLKLIKCSLQTAFTASSLSNVRNPKPRCGWQENIKYCCQKEANMLNNTHLLTSFGQIIVNYGIKNVNSNVAFSGWNTTWCYINILYLWFQLNKTSNKTFCEFFTDTLNTKIITATDGTNVVVVNI